MHNFSLSAEQAHPIIYVRGFAMTERGIEGTVHSLYMGFNDGSTRIRQQYDRSYRRYIFESPLLRLMKEYGYEDIYRDGIDVLEDENASLSPRSIIIHRFYENSEDGSSQRISIEDAARQLSELISRVRDAVTRDNPAQRNAFKVYLVGHSMGGLICRCLLQNNQVDIANSAALVDKVFTYGTPHNGIEFFGINVPAIFNFMDVSNFSRRRMAEYLRLSDPQQVNSLDGHFNPERFFCLIGTNPHDYSFPRMLVDQASDGLVTMANAYVQNAPRVHSYTSHSGPYGMVNSKEGYDNLTRFLFGDFFLRLDMEIANLPLPPPVERASERGQQIRGSYLFDCTITPRGDDPVPLSSRRREHGSAVFRSYDELFHPENEGRDLPRSPVLASVFLDSERITEGKTIVLAVELAVDGIDFRIGRTRLRRVPDDHLFREHLTLKITLHPTAPRVRFITSDTDWSDGRGRDVEFNPERQAYALPLNNKKGFKSTLWLTLRPWD